MRTLLILLLALSSVSANTVILPERFADAKVVTKNSVEYKALAARLAKQLEAERTQRIEFTQTVDADLRAKAEELSKLQAENAKLKASQSHSRWGIFSTLFGAFSIGVSFVSNPLGFVISFLIKLSLALVVLALFFFAVRFAVRWLRKQH